MARNEFDLHNTANKEDELTTEEIRTLVSWWTERALPLMGAATDEDLVRGCWRNEELAPNPE